MLNKARNYASARCCCIALVGALGVFLPSLHSQNAPAPSATQRIATPSQLTKYDLNRDGTLNAAEQAAFEAGESSDAVQLTPFEVNTSKDRGYAAGNTLSGGRMDTPLALTPTSISIMTKEFLDDFAITDLIDAAQWTMNTDIPSGFGGDAPFGGSRFEFNIRGAGGGGSYPLRDGMVQYFVADGYNSERFEVISGPNASAAGLGNPGGLSGSASKRVRFNNRSVSVGARVDNFDGYRGTLDYNWGGDRFGVRVNALHQDVKNIQNVSTTKQNAITVALSFKISDKTLISAFYERSAEVAALYRRTYGDQASFWDRTTVNLTNTLLPTTPAGQPGTGLSLISQNNDRLTYNFGTNSLLNYRGIQYQTTGLGYQIPWAGRPDLPQQYPGSANFQKGIAKDFYLGPADNYSDRDNNTRMVAIDHVFTPNLSARLSWQGSDVDPLTIYTNFSQPGDYRIDVNRLLPDGVTTNPNYLRAYSEWTGGGSQYQQNENDEYVAMVNYRFEAPRLFGLKQHFNLIGGYVDGTYEAWQRFWRRNNNPAQLNPLNGVNELRFRTYYGDPQPRMAPFLNQAALNALMPGTTWGHYDQGFVADNIRDRNYMQIHSMSSFFDDRLIFSGGARRDKLMFSDLGFLRNDPANNYKAVLGALNPATGANEDGYRARLNVSKLSYNVGIVTYPFKNMDRPGSGWLRPLGFVVNYSENFQAPPTGGPFFTGERPVPPFNKTLDFALRFSIPNGKVYGEIRRYFTNNTGNLGGMQNEGDIRDIWTNLGYTDAEHVNFGGYRDINDRDLTGTELEVVANPTPNWTLRANYGHPTVKTISERKFLRQYVDANIAEWRAGANAQVGQVINGRTIVSPELVAQNIQDIENAFNGLSPGTLGNGPLHRGSIATSYNFREGRFKGLGLSGGVSWRGSSKQGSRDTRLKFQTTANPLPPAQTAAAAYDYLWVPSQLTNNAGINYSRKFGKYNARFQLNVTNILNDDDPLWSGYSTINAGQLTNQNNGTALTVAGSNPRMQVLSGFNNPEPRKFIFQTTVSF